MTDLPRKPIAPGLADRIETLLRAKRLTGRALARLAKLSDSHVNLMLMRLRQGDYEPTDRTLRAIATGAAINYYWLRDAHGDMTGPEIPPLGSAANDVTDERPMSPRELAELSEAVAPTMLRAILRLSPEKRAALAEIIRHMG